MRPDRIITTVLVAALVAVAGFTGAVTAAEPADATVAQQVQPDDVQSVTVSSMVVENLSTDLQLEGATITVETAEGTQEVTVDSATVTLQEATVEVTNATLANGTLTLESANVSITDGQVEIQSSHGDRSMDLSDTNQSVEEVTIQLNESMSEGMDLSEDLSEVTIRQMTVEDISGEADVGVLVANMQVEGERETQNMSVSMQNASMSVEGATVTLENASVEDGTLMIESVEGSVQSGQVEAERLVLLHGFDLQEHQNVQRSVENQQFSAQNVEVDIEEWTQMLEELLGTQMAAEGES